MGHPLVGKVVIITGASSGIGAATARCLARLGCKLTLAARSTDKLRALADELGEAALVVPTDVTVGADVARMVAQTIAHFGRVDVLFANAGIAKFAPVSDVLEDAYDETFDINVKGVFFTVQTLLPLLKDEGSIVLTASIVANKGLENFSLYSASKAAVRSFARSWANDLKGRKIRVNALSPGLTRTPIMENGLKLDAAQIAALDDYAATAVPAGYMAQPEDIAGAALFLASPAARYINGVELTVDGGMTQI